MTALAMTFAACSNEEDILDNKNSETTGSPVEVAFSAGITTRVTGNEWEAEDLIGISANDGAGVTYNNVKYKVAGAGASTDFSPVDAESAICFQNAGTMTFTAYYPYTDVSATEGKIAKNTATMPQTGVDFLWASVSNKAYSETPTVNFTFNHRMSQLNFIVISDAGVDITGMKITLKGLKHAGTFNTTNGIAAANLDATPEIWTIGTPADNNEYKFTGLVYPQNANSLVLKVGDLTATLDLNENKLDAGHKYTITATVKENKLNAKITVAGNTIENWEDGASAKIAFISNAGTESELDSEAKTAYDWLVSNSKYKVTYISIGRDNASANIDQYKMVWTHFNWSDGGLGDMAGINNAIKNYYATGGAILASREAMCSLIGWGIVPDGNGINWKFGDGTNEELDYEAGILSDKYDHALFNGFSLTGNGQSIVLHPNPYTSSKRMRGWGENDDATALASWLTATGAVRLAYDGGHANSVTIAEISKTANHGCAIAIGDPAFEWNGVTTESEHADNLYKLTTNAIDYLISQSTK